MATAIPSIACLGVIGRNNNPLHISIFPSHDPATNTLKPIRTPLQFSLLLSSTLDVFDLRAKHSAVTGGTNGPMSGDYGLLHAVDERLAAYGYETNTGVKFVVVVDMRGRRIDSAALPFSSSGNGPDNNNNNAGGAGGGGGKDALVGRRRVGAAVVGLREGDMKVVFRAMQTAYVRLLQNPFYEPDEHAPLAGCGGRRITSRRFGGDMRRIGEGWTVGVTSL
ncbi:Trafficking protein particle complex subunit 2-like protein [Cytospora mali]|uniref:Trafficking protein particle complex subunit 2-like protein n=1 Tax=Cytospora mali TaxID=578113 RepID=A0A194WCS1_CYTMA|nr:Trafficking protein particle complex subunit 2-like protein [Valsa mali]